LPTPNNTLVHLPFKGRPIDPAETLFNLQRPGKLESPQGQIVLTRRKILAEFLLSCGKRLRGRNWTPASKFGSP